MCSSLFFSSIWGNFLSPGSRPTIRELQKQLLDLEKGVHGPAAGAKKSNPPGHYVGKIGKDDWNVRQLEERLKEREKGRTEGEKKKSAEKPQVGWISEGCASIMALQFDGDVESEEDEEETVGPETVNKVRPLSGVLHNCSPLRTRDDHRTTPLEQALGRRKQDKLRVSDG